MNRCILGRGKETKFKIKTVQIKLMSSFVGLFFCFLFMLERHTRITKANAYVHQMVFFLHLLLSHHIVVASREGFFFKKSKQCRLVYHQHDHSISIYFNIHRVFYFKLMRCAHVRFSQRFAFREIVSFVTWYWITLNLICIKIQKFGANSA